MLRLSRFKKALLLILDEYLMYYLVLFLETSGQAFWRSGGTHPGGLVAAWVPGQLMSIGLNHQCAEPS